MKNNKEATDEEAPGDDESKSENENIDKNKDSGAPAMPMTIQITIDAKQILTFIGGMVAMSAVVALMHSRKRN